MPMPPPIEPPCIVALVMFQLKGVALDTRIPGADDGRKVLHVTEVPDWEHVGRGCLGGGDDDFRGGGVDANETAATPAQHAKVDTQWTYMLGNERRKVLDPCCCCIPYM